MRWNVHANDKSCEAPQLDLAFSIQASRQGHHRYPQQCEPFSMPRQGPYQMKMKCFAFPQGCMCALCNKDDKISAIKRSQAIVKLPLQTGVSSLSNVESSPHAAASMLRKRSVIKGMPAKHVWVHAGCLKERRGHFARPGINLQAGNTCMHQSAVRPSAHQTPAQAKRTRTIPHPAPANKRLRATTAMHVDHSDASSTAPAPVRAQLMSVVLQLHAIMQQIEVHLLGLDEDFERQRLSLKFCDQVDYVGLGMIHGLWLSLADPLLQAFMEDQRIAAGLDSCENDVQKLATKLAALKQDSPWLSDRAGLSTEEPRIHECLMELALAQETYESLLKTAAVHNQKLAMMTSKVQDVLTIVQQYQEDIRKQDMTFSSLFTTRQNLYAVFGAIA